jgi:hypothetical protein
MKKIIALILSLVCVIGLVGCGDKNVDAEVNVPNESIEQEATNPNEENNTVENDDNKLETEEDDEEVDPSIIDAKFFTIKLPESWLEECSYGIGEDGSVMLLCQACVDKEEGGKLVTIRIAPIEMDYKQFPETSFLGTIETENGKCNVLLMYPSDVQSGSETASSYNKMKGELQSVLDTLEFKPEAKFVKAE